MKENYFLINGTTYIISYQDFKLNIYKIVNKKRIELSGIEREYMDDIISKNSSYIYTSIKLEEVINNNSSINTKEMAPNLLEWIESFIPLDSRENFYKNIETLKIEEVDQMPYKETLGYYNAKENTIVMLPQSKYENEETYILTLLHELLHMSATKYNKETGEIVSGLDKVGSDFVESNKGLTEGIIQSILYICMNQIAKKDIEGLIVDQLSKIINPVTIIESYFENKGITDIKNGLDNISKDSTKSDELLRDIEINYYFDREASQQNVLGSIQSNLVDFFELKIKNGIMDNSIDISSLPDMFNEYEQSLITPEKLELMGKEPECYEGIKESIIKFDEYKRRYTDLAKPATESYNQGYSTSKAGFSSVVLLTIITGIIALGIIVFGVYLGM